MRVMRRRASFIGAAMPKRIECIDDRFLLIADDPHFTTQWEILSGRTKNQNSGVRDLFSAAARASESHTDAGSRSGRRSFQVIVSLPSRRNGTQPAGASVSSA